ncbi:nuclear transport factor 2 family protein [Muriicola sp. Z0-33]|uniref:nuclear transport factor 2 family protein n=1 Tax=Muriicola sp. Z0-33 TaxID=2816957 RepID=UPI00223790AF|nr:nuclear transport factor 2 family protein [Muriicola sp. Z0-33]MCW5517121.1 DUF4440 domain-containing protein [Muriicola sp. Z0-33]
MKPITSFLLALCSILITFSVYPQDNVNNPEKVAIYTVIEMYVQAREQLDTLMLNNILTSDMDQLVSSGNWRNNREMAIEGMLRSSANNPGKRKLTIKKLRFLNAGCALVDCQYQIINPNGKERNMWSSFVLVTEDGKWKISSIRNMLPSRSQ